MSNPAEQKSQTKPSYFVYQDESGTVGTTGKFIVGLLFVKDRRTLYNHIAAIRQKHSYTKELHFKDIHYFSSKRSRVACEIVETLLREHLFFRALAIDNEQLRLEHFEPRVKRREQLPNSEARGVRELARARAYNYFTKQLIFENISVLENAVVYLDKKIRVKADNIQDYLKREANLKAGRAAIKVVEPRDSKHDDLIGVADLVLGAINYLVKEGKNPMKLAVVNAVKPYISKKIRFREWKFSVAVSK